MIPPTSMGSGTYWGTGACSNNYRATSSKDPQDGITPRSCLKSEQKNSPAKTFDLGVIKVFDTIHNHELERKEYKRLSKAERQLTYIEQAFIVKAASVNIGDSDAQMLIHNMENRKKHADEVSKYNYREFGDVVSFDATFNTNKYKMVFVPFTAIDNHKKCVTVAAAFGKAPSIVVIDQDGAMRNAIETEFGGSKHRLMHVHSHPTSFLLSVYIIVIAAKDFASVGGKEKAIEKSLKGRNINVSLCGGTDHNKRTCPGRFEDQNEVVVQKEVGQEEVVQEKIDLAEDEEELVEEDEDLIHE
ncbi:FAR1-related sequence 5-like protein [Tanacetum coccineum]